MLAIIDFGYGNIESVRNMFQKIGEKNIILACSDDDLQKADKLVLPGVGTFDTGMELLNQSGMREELNRQVLELHKPILGICLGMQMLGIGSEEGKKEGLKYIPFECKRFDFQDIHLKVPHMGWDYINICDRENKLVKNIGNNPRYYFVHSYYAVCKKTENILMTCDYGIRFAAAIHDKNIYGTQFHPEKSHKFGMKIFENFIKEI